jgi:hypothetical protein
MQPMLFGLAVFWDVQSSVVVVAATDTLAARAMQLKCWGYSGQRGGSGSNGYTGSMCDAVGGSGQV